MTMNNETSKRAARRPRVEERDPLLAAKAIERYAETGSLTATSKSTGLPRSTVKAILTRRSDDFDAVKKVIAQRAAVLAETCLERAQKQAGKLTPYQALVGAKISTDHMFLALGRDASALVSINFNAQNMDALSQKMADAQRITKELEARLRAITASDSPAPAVIDVPESAEPDGRQEEAKA